MNLIGLFGRIIKNPVTTLGGIAATVVLYATNQADAFTWHGLVNDLPMLLGLFAKDK